MLRPWFWLFSPVLAALCGSAADDGRFYAGAYSFSDELGGFRILDAKGTGSRNDPIIITEELQSASRVTLVIRAAKPIRPFDYSADFANGFLHVEIATTNRSGHGWIGFEFELQEQRGLPSVFGDGLSFDQRKSDSETVGSNSFRHNSRDFEPEDRLVFSEGAIDPGAAGTFRFFITDFTPKSEFYLVQDPRIPLS